MKTGFMQYSARLEGRIWSLNTFGPDGIEKQTFDSCSGMTAWIKDHMADIESSAKIIAG